MTKIYYSERTIEDLNNIELIKKFKHKNRNNLFNLSRFALGDIVNLKNKTQLDWKSIKLNNHREIEGLSQFTCSLTHSKETSIAVGSRAENVASLGIDLEFKNRPMKSGSNRFFINDLDIFLTEDSLLKWCIKEACFKALSNNNHPIKLLKEVVVNGNNFYFENEALAYLNQFQIVDEDDKLIVIAHCFNAPTEEEMEITKINHG